MTRLPAACLTLLALLAMTPSAALAQDLPQDAAASRNAQAVEDAHWDAIRDKLEKHADTYVDYWDEWLDQWWFFDTWADDDYQEQIDIIDAQLRLDIAYTRERQGLGVAPTFPPGWDPRSPAERYADHR